MKPYATFEDIADRYGPVDEEGRVQVLLLDATAIIAANGGLPGDDLSEVQAFVYKTVCCAMVHRVMISPAYASAGVTSHSQQAGSMMESFSYANPNGDLYMTQAERKTLGLKKMALGSIAPARMPPKMPGEEE